MPSTRRQREEVLNVTLASCLLSRGVSASPETIVQHHQMPDVLFDYKGLRCAIEGKIGQSPQTKAAATRDAKKRVDYGIAHIAVGVVYPEYLRTTSYSELQERVNQATLSFKIISESGSGDWRDGDIDDILEELRRAHDTVVRNDVVVRAVEILNEGIEVFSSHILTSNAISDRVADTLGIGKVKPSQLQKKRLTAASIASLTIANAIIFQEQLSNEDSRVQTINSLRGNADFISALIGHWRFIVENINYVPIFKIATDILTNITSTANGNQALTFLANKSLEVLAERAALRHDLMGRIYHKLLLDAKYLGTYYTSVPAATLLAKLSLDPSKWNIDWSNLTSISEFKIGDITCGTGTLLMASGQAVVDNFIRKTVSNGNRLEENNSREIHQILMENVIHGYDVLASAVHLTASTLAMLSPEISFSGMKLYVLPMGKVGRTIIRLGSVDYLTLNTIRMQRNLFDTTQQLAAGNVTGEGDHESNAELPPLDLIIMNPPFVSSRFGNLLFGTIPQHRREMQQELQKIFRRTPQLNGTVNITAGLGAVFVVVADIRLKVGGRMSFILPSAITTGSSWQNTRNLIERDCNLEYLISSHDPERWAFSENTDLSEIMFVAKKNELNSATNEENGHAVNFINLWKNPTSSAEALGIGNAAINCQPADIGSCDLVERGITSIRVGDIKYGESIKVDYSKIKGEPWILNSFAQTDLIRCAWYMRQGFLYLPDSVELHQLPFCQLTDLGEIGPDGRDAHDGFELSEVQTQYAALWGHDTEYVNKIYLQPNQYLEARATAAPNRPLRRVSSLWPRSAKLMLASRMWLNTTRLICTRLTRQALSNVWWPFKLNEPNDKIEKAIALWLNSTLGILSVVAHRVPTRGPWVQLKKPNWLDLPILDIRTLPSAQLDLLSNLFDNLSNNVFDSLPNMSHDEVREEIDQLFIDILNLHDLENLKRMLAQEPIITTLPLYN